MNNDCSLYAQIEEFMSTQSGMNVVEVEKDFQLSGLYSYSLTYDGIIFEDSIKIKLIVPKDFPRTAVTLFLDNIPVGFDHVYADGSVCLATCGEISYYLIKRPSVIEFVEYFINPFIFTLEYYRTYGNYPFGERAHGAEGLLSYYSEVWNLTKEHLYEMVKIVCSGNYRGHHLCFCHSGKKIRSCHGKILQNILSSDEIKIRFIEEICMIFIEEEKWYQKNKDHKMRHLFYQKN